MSHPALVHVSQRPRRWRRALVLATAIATLTPIAGLATSNVASADMIVPSGQPTACPTKPSDLASLAGTYDASNDLHSLLMAEAATFPKPYTSYTTTAPVVAGGSTVLKAGATVIRRGIGASTYYANGYFGQGIGVALIDTGVNSTLPGLNNGNVVKGIDLSFDSQAGYATAPGVPDSTLPHNDGYGHGTHLAGIIAGSDATNVDRSVQPGKVATYPGWSDSSQFTGIAPLSHVIDVRTGDSNGAVDVTQMIAAVDWVVKHRNDPGMNIRVLNLSYGVQALDQTKTDALSYAVEQAWKAGIVVVVADGNGGLSVVDQYNPGVTSPAINNDVIAVGPYDPATMLVPPFSSYSSRTNARNPDVVAPGQSIPSLHVFGSEADEVIANDCVSTVTQTTGTCPNGSAPPCNWTPPVLSTATAPARFVRASGTSQAAAVVSGAVALMLSKNPSMSPDYVKAVLRQSAAPLPGSQQVTATGQGSIDLSAAYSKVPTQLQSNATVTGGGLIELARGATPDGSNNDLNHGMAWTALLPGACTPGNQYYPTYCELEPVDTLNGNVDWLGNPVNVTTLEQAEAAGAAWMTSPDGQSEYWVGDPAVKTTGVGMVSDPIFQSVWSPVSPWASDWAGHGWAGFDWSGHGWAGHGWADAAFSSHGWAGHGWVGHGWAGHGWADFSFRDSQWS